MPRQQTLQVPSITGHSRRHARRPLSANATTGMRRHWKIEYHALRKASRRATQWVVGVLSLSLAGPAVHSGDASTALSPFIQRVRSVDSTCAAANGRPERMLVDDGATTMTIDVSGVSQDGTQLMIVGSPVNVFAVRSGKDRVALPVKPSIGAIRDVRGTWRLVPSPLPAQAVVYPRAASADSGGWNVLFVTAGKPDQAGRQADSATIWYGRYDGQSWSKIEKVANAGHAALDRRSSRLVAVRDSLAFAFIIGRYEDESLPRGVVMLIRRRDHWMQDTLRTWDVPAGVQVETRSAASPLFVVIAQDYFKDHRVKPQSIFVVRYDSAWGEPKLLAGDSGWADATPTIQTSDKDRFLITWRRLRVPPLHGAQIQWAFVDDTGRIGSARTLADVGGLATPDIARLNGSRFLVAAREGDSPRSMKLFLISDARMQDLGSVEVPNWSPSAVAIPESDTSAILLTGELGPPGSSPPAWTDVTVVSVRCSPKS